MKKLCLFMLCAFLGCLGFTAGAEDVQITLKWDNPGAINAKVSNVAVDIPAGATEYTIVRDKSSWPSAVITAATGYQLVSCTYTDDSGAEKTIALRNNQFSISMTSTLYIGRTFTIVTNKLDMSDDLTINVENGAAKIQEVKLSGTGAVLSPIVDGENRFKFASSVDKQLTISPIRGQKVYKVSVDGKDVTRLNDYQPYTVDITNGSVVTVRVYENDSDIPQQVKVTFSENTPLECIKSVMNSTTLASPDFSSGSFTVEQGDKIRVYFNEGWTVSGVTLNGSPVTLNTDYSGTPYIFNLPITEASVLEVTATPKTYDMIPFTAYITEAEGIELWAGNQVNGEKIDLGEGETVNEAVTLPAYKEEGVSIAAYTVPAGTLKKYTFDVSSKYGTVNYYIKDGYWLREARQASLKASLNNPVSASGFYLIAEKIENDSEITVYLGGDPSVIRFSTAGSGRNITLAEGYNTVDYDADYDGGFKVRFYGEVESLTFVINGVKADIKPDDNGIYVPDLKPGDVFKVYYGTAVSPFDVKFETEEGAEAEVTYDKVVKLTDLNSTVSNYKGTEFVVKPLKGATVALDGEALTPDENGNCVFVADAAHTVSIAKALVYTFTPEPGQETDAIDPIVISFPEAATVVRNETMADDEILFRQGWSWMSPVTVEAVADATHPSFAIRCTQTPVSKGSYTLLIPAGFFTIDGKPNPDIEAYFEFSGKQVELVAQYSPEGNIPAGEYLNVAVVFPEGQIIEADQTLTQNMYLGFTAAGGAEQELVYGTDFNVYAESNMMLFDVTSTDVLGKTGTLMLSIGAGAFKVNGQSSPEIYNMWSVVEPRTYEFVITPDSSGEVYDLSEITIAISGADYAVINSPTGVSLRNGYGANAYYQTATLTEVADAEIPTFKAVFDPKPETDGPYTFTINYATFGIDGMADNDYITKVYDLTTGVEDITVDVDGDAVIYNLQGVRVDLPWNELPAGIYIVGGVKVAK